MDVLRRRSRRTIRNRPMNRLQIRLMARRRTEMVLVHCMMELGSRRIEKVRRRRSWSRRNRLSLVFRSFGLVLGNYHRRHHRWKVVGSCRLDAQMGNLHPVMELHV